MNSQSKTPNRFGSESPDLLIYPPLDSEAIPNTNTSEEASDASDLINEARSAIFQTSNMTVAERAKQAQDILRRQNDSFRKPSNLASKANATVSGHIHHHNEPTAMPDVLIHQIENDDMVIPSQILEEMQLGLRTAMSRTEIQAKFKGFEDVANLNKKWHNWLGAIALVTLICCLIFATFQLVANILFPLNVRLSKDVISVALAIGMIPVIASTLLYVGGFRKKWVLARYKAERIRHWKFHQLLDGTYIAMLNQSFASGEKKTNDPFLLRWEALMEELALGEGSLQDFISNDEFGPVFLCTPYSDVTLFKNALDLLITYRLRFQLLWFTREAQRYMESDKTSEGIARVLLFFVTVIIFLDAVCHFFLSQTLPLHTDIVLAGIGIALSLIGAGVNVYRSASGISEIAKRYQNTRIQLVQLQRDIERSDVPEEQLRLMLDVERVCHMAFVYFLRTALKSGYWI